MLNYVFVLQTVLITNMSFLYLIYFSYSIVFKYRTNIQSKYVSKKYGLLTACHHDSFVVEHLLRGKRVLGRIKPKLQLQDVVVRSVASHTKSHHSDCSALYSMTVWL